MGYPVRFTFPDQFYLLTCRTIEQRFLLRPSEEVNKIVGEWLVRAQRMYGVEIYAFVFLSDHWHIVCRSPRANLDRFLRYFEGLLATFLNKHWQRSGTVFPRRCSVEPIVDEERLIERIVYLLANPARADLVESIDDWPGFSSGPESMHRKSRTIRIFDRTAWHKARRPADKSPYEKFVRLVIEAPPSWRNLSPKERAERLKKLVYAREEELRQERNAKERKVLGVRRVKEASPNDRPANPKKSPRPLCHASTRELWEEYRAQYARFLELYKAASARFRAGELDVSFPPGSFPPWYRGAA